MEGGPQMIGLGRLSLSLFNLYFLLLLPTLSMLSPLTADAPLSNNGSWPCARHRHATRLLAFKEEMYERTMAKRSENLARASTALKSLFEDKFPFFWCAPRPTAASFPAHLCSPQLTLWSHCGDALYVGTFTNRRIRAKTHSASAT